MSSLALAPAVGCGNFNWKDKLSSGTASLSGSTLITTLASRTVGTSSSIVWGGYNTVLAEAYLDDGGIYTP